MARSYMTCDGSVITETGTRSYQTPDGVVTETQAHVSGVDDKKPMNRGCDRGMDRGMSA
jgi:hypothetical protein